MNQNCKVIYEYPVKAVKCDDQVLLYTKKRGVVTCKKIDVETLEVITNNVEFKMTMKAIHLEMFSYKEYIYEFLINKS